MTAPTKARKVQYERCPACDQQVYLRADGTLGAHFAVERKSTGRYRCPNAGTVWRPAPRRRRVAVTVDAVLPDGWSGVELRAAVVRALAEIAADAFITTIKITEEA